MRWCCAVREPMAIRGRWRYSIRPAAKIKCRGSAVCAALLNSQLAIATSGSYRHFLTADGQRYSHIIDARSGRPVQHATVSVTVQHSDAALADAWSTALLCLGREQGMAVAEDNAVGALFIEQLADGDRRADDTQGRVRYRESVTAAWRDEWRD